MTADTTMMMLMIIAIMPIVGILLAIIPYLVKKGEVFAVTVPETSVQDPFIKGLKLRYTLIVFALTVLLTLLSLAFLLAQNELGVIVTMGIGTLLLCAGSYALMLYFRKKVRGYKTSMGWVAQHQERTAVVLGMEVPRPISLAWNLLYLPIIAITAAVGYFGYGLMPGQIPIHMGLNGEINTMMDKNTLVIWIPVVVQVFMALCFFSSHWIITRSKRLSDPGAPAVSSLAYGMFAHAQSLYIVAGGLLMAAALITMPLSFMGRMSLMQTAVLIVIAAFVLIIGALVVSVVYGQGGARVFKRMQETSILLADEDQHWKLGVFYFNRDDPNWFLPARFGIGWTCNFARPFVWVLGVLLTVLTIAFIVVMLAMT